MFFFLRSTGCIERLECHESLYRKSSDYQIPLYPQYCGLYAMAGFYILGLYLPDLSMCVCAHVFPRVLWLLDCFSLCEGVPKRKGLDIPIREMKATCIQRSIWWTLGWRSWLRRWMFHDFLCSWIRSSWIYDDLCCFVMFCWAWAKINVEMCWDILYIWELGGLCCVVGWNFQVLFQDLVKFIFHERTWVCNWSCLETKT